MQSPDCPLDHRLERMWSAAEYLQWGESKRLPRTKGREAKVNWPCLVIISPLALSYKVGVTVQFVRWLIYRRLYKALLEAGVSCDYVRFGYYISMSMSSSTPETGLRSCLPLSSVVTGQILKFPVAASQIIGSKASTKRCSLVYTTDALWTGWSYKGAYNKHNIK